jgi:hypothetical protein
MNILLNPLHPDASKLIVTESNWLRYDKRLSQLDVSLKQTHLLGRSLSRSEESWGQSAQFPGNIR